MVFILEDINLSDLKDGGAAMRPQLAATCRWTVILSPDRSQRRISAQCMQIDPKFFLHRPGAGHAIRDASPSPGMAMIIWSTDLPAWDKD